MTRKPRPEALRALRLQCGLTQAQAGALAHLHGVTVCRYERGELDRLSVKRASELAEADILRRALEGAA